MGGLRGCVKKGALEGGLRGCVKRVHYRVGWEVVL